MDKYIAPDDPAAALHWGVAARRCKVICLLIHGRGQTAEDMIGTVVGHLHVSDVHYVLPRASGKSWYKARAIDPVTEHTVAQVTASLDQVAAELETAKAAANPGCRIVVAGFSQGACIALEFALRRSEPIAAVCAFTGSRIAPREDLPTKDLDGLPIYLSGSDDDPWIPAEEAALTAASLSRARARLRFDSFPGRPHLVSPPEVAVLDRILSRLGRGDDPFEDQGPV